MSHAQFDLKLAAGERELTSVPLATLQQWVAERRVTRRDWVRPVGATTWLGVAQVPELAAHFPAGTAQTTVGNHPAAAASSRKNTAGKANAVDRDADETSSDLGIREPSRRRRRKSRRRQLEETAMEMTPMIDVTFQLLIFFMFANQLANPSPIEVPEARYGRGMTTDGVQMILVDAEGQCYLGESTKPENVAPSLAAALEEVRANADQAGEPLEVIINAHKKARHQSIRRLVDGLEEISGIGNVRLGVEEQP